MSAIEHVLEIHQLQRKAGAWAAVFSQDISFQRTQIFTLSSCYRSILILVTTWLEHIVSILVLCGCMSRA